MAERTPPNRTDLSLEQSVERRNQIDAYYDDGMPGPALAIILETYRPRFLARLHKGFSIKTRSGGPPSSGRVADEHEADGLFNHAVANFHQARVLGVYRGDGTQRLEPLLWRILRNLAVDYARKRREATESVFDTPDPGPSRPINQVADKSAIAAMMDPALLEKIEARLVEYASDDQRLSWAPTLWRLILSPECDGRPRPTDRELAAELNWARALVQSRRNQLEQLVKRAAEELGITE